MKKVNQPELRLVRLQSIDILTNSNDEIPQGGPVNPRVQERGYYDEE